MRRVQVAALAVASSTLIISTTGCATKDRAEPASTPPMPSVSSAPDRDVLLLGSGRNRRATQTAGDWVTYADHVLVVTVVDEIRDGPSQEEIDRGEGLIGRVVQLRVDKALWSAPDVPQPAPTVLNLQAAGWAFNTNERRGTAKFALEESSRLELGHTYVKAIEWVDDPCYDDPKRGSWEALGSGDTIPFDGGVLGAGEFEGRVQTLAEAKAKWPTNTAASGLRERMAGSTIENLTARLQAASPGPKTGYESTECDLSDR